MCPKKIDPDVLLRLQNVRKKLVKENGKTALNLIFTNLKLSKIIENKCETLNDLKKIKGFGEENIKKYGQFFLDALLQVDTPTPVTPAGVTSLTKEDEEILMSPIEEEKEEENPPPSLPSTPASPLPIPTVTPVTPAPPVPAPTPVTPVTPAPATPAPAPATPTTPSTPASAPATPTVPTPSPTSTPTPTPATKPVVTKETKPSSKKSKNKPIYDFKDKSVRV